MLVVERRQLEQRQQQAAGRRRIRYMHALGEASGLPDASQVGRCWVRLIPLVWRRSSALPTVGSGDWL